MHPFGPNNDLKERVKDASEIVDVISGYMELRKQGAAYVALCPWHQDRRPSLQINPVRQSWVCWVCNIRGDIFDFVMQYEKVEFREALEILANRAGIPVNQFQKRIVKGSVDDKQALFSACSWAEQEFHNRLLSSPDAEPVREYLAERGISDESIEAFRIGFAPDSFSWLMDRARNTSHSVELLEACDLVKPRNTGGFYDTFRARVVFPIHDTKGRAIAFGGRVVPGLVPEEKQSPAKYLNSKETRLFSKSDSLFGIDKLDNETKREGKLTIVEGYTDVVGAWQAGLRNVVAVLGTALNDRHIRTLKRYADQITLVLDGDAAGQKRANEVLDLFVANDIDLRILTLPEGLDPFDFLVNNGAGPFEEMIAAAPDAVEHKIRVETRGVDLLQDTHAANQALERILGTLARMPASLFTGSAGKVLRQDQLLMRLARRFSLELDQIRSRMLELRSSLRSREPFHADQLEPPSEEEFDLGQMLFREREIVQLMLLESSLVDLAIENIFPGQFIAGPMREIYETAVELFHDGELVNYQTLMNRFEDARIRSLLTQLAEEAELKKLAVEGQNEFEIAPQQQMTLVVQSFHEDDHESRKRAAITKLQQGVQEDDEVSLLEQLLEQTRSKHLE